MRNTEKDPRRSLENIIAKYDRPEVVKMIRMDGGLDPLWARFERVAMNQEGGGPATIALYAIWSNTVRDNIIEGLNLLDRVKRDDAKKLFIRGANSLGVFAEYQQHMDPLMDPEQEK